MPKPIPLQRVGLRKKGATLSAIRATAPVQGTLLDGTPVFAKVGDWVVYGSIGNQVVAVITNERFPHPYEIVAEGTVTLSRADCEAIEAITGIGTTQTPAALVLAVSRLARIRIGEVEVPFTPGQMEELRHRAEKRGQTLQQTLQAVVDRIRDEIFHRG